MQQNNKHINLFFISLIGLFCSIGCFNTCTKTENPEMINIDSLRLTKGTKIVTALNGYYKLDSNAVLPRYDSTLFAEYDHIEKLIESSTNFKLKTEWYNGNDSPSDGIWLEYLTDKPKGFYIISTTEGQIGIYGSSRESIKNGITMLEKLFIPAFHEKLKRDEWYLPMIIIEHYD